MAEVDVAVWYNPLLVHCGTIWVHGPALRVPVTEDEPRTGYGEYGMGKVEIEALLHQETLPRGQRPGRRGQPVSHDCPLTQLGVIPAPKPN
jgi:hypothetical protein